MLAPCSRFAYPALTAYTATLSNRCRCQTMCLQSMSLESHPHPSRAPPFRWEPFARNIPARPSEPRPGLLTTYPLSPHLIISVDSSLTIPSSLTPIALNPIKHKHNLACLGPIQTTICSAKTRVKIQVTVSRKEGGSPGAEPTCMSTFVSSSADFFLSSRYLFICPTRGPVEAHARQRYSSLPSLILLRPHHHI